LLREPTFAFGHIRRMPLAARLSYGLAYAVSYLFSPLLLRFLDRITEGQEVECSLVTLSAVMREYRIETIDLLKIDVEGAELDVLNGIAAADWPRIRQISMESHTSDGRADDVISLLTTRGFVVSKARPKWARVSGVMDNVNIYASRNHGVT
jgi:Methyltransferase FkbM domain